MSSWSPRQFVAYCLDYLFDCLHIVCSTVARWVPRMKAPTESCLHSSLEWDNTVPCCWQEKRSPSFLRWFLLSLSSSSSSLSLSLSLLSSFVVWCLVFIVVVPGCCHCCPLFLLLILLTLHPTSGFFTSCMCWKQCFVHCILALQYFIPGARSVFCTMVHSSLCFRTRETERFELGRLREC